MRTIPKDQGIKVIRFSAAVADAASGFGFAQPGNIFYAFTRTATGVYVYGINSNLLMISALVTPMIGSFAQGGGSDSLSAGAFRVLVSSAGVAANGAHQWDAVAFDRRLNRS